MKALLERTTSAIADRLRQDFENLTGDQLENETTWQTVAESCVVTVVRHLVGMAGEAEATLTPQEFTGLNQVLGTPEFAIRTGLPLDDARLALAVTSTNLARAFVTRTTLKLDGSEFALHNVSGKLTVQRLA